jgi:hypothetical protein
MIRIVYLSMHTDTSHTSKTFQEKVKQASIEEAIQLHLQRYKVLETFARNFLQKHKPKHTIKIQYRKQPTTADNSLMSEFSKKLIETGKIVDIITIGNEYILDASKGSINQNSDLDIQVKSINVDLMMYWCAFLKERARTTTISFAHQWDCNLYLKPCKLDIETQTLKDILLTHWDSLMPSNKESAKKIAEYIQQYCKAYMNKASITSTGQANYPNPDSDTFDAMAEIAQYEAHVEAGDKMFDTFNRGNMMDDYLAFTTTQQEAFVFFGSLMMIGLFGDDFAEIIKTKFNNDCKLGRPLCMLEFLYNLKMHATCQDKRKIVKLKYVERLYNTLKGSVNECTEHSDIRNGKITILLTKHKEDKKAPLNDVQDLVREIVSDEINLKNCVKISETTAPDNHCQGECCHPETVSVIDNCIARIHDFIENYNEPAMTNVN